MIENTLENKAKFFAQYWGQKFVYTGTGRAIKRLGSEIVMNYENANEFQSICFSNQRAVLLKPLSQISDEDAIEVGKLLFDNKTGIQIERTHDAINILGSEIVYIWFEDAEILYDDASVQSPLRILSAYDYLRSEGYLLPWNGLSEKQLIDYGWVKIKSD